MYLTNAAGTNDAKLTPSGRLKVQTTGKANVNVVNSNRVAWDDRILVKTTDGTVEVVDVPAGEVLVVTDVVMGHNISGTTGLFKAFLGRSSNNCTSRTDFIGVWVRAERMEAISLSSGIHINGGQQLCTTATGGGINEGLNFTLSGYYIIP